MTEREKPAACYRDRNNGVRYIKSGHRLDCGDGDCRGCKPCPERWHCTAGRTCTWHLEPGQLTCGRCLASVRRNLRRIGDLSALMFPAAIAGGVNSGAANLAGPAADYSTFVARRLIDQRWIDQYLPEHNQIRAAEALIEDDDPHHPYNVLTRWEFMLREDYGQSRPHWECRTGIDVLGGRERDREKCAVNHGQSCWLARETPTSIYSAMDYLDRNLHRIAQDDEQDFPLLGRELKKCRQHLEAVLRNDDRPDRGAPCPECTSDTAGVGPRLRREYAHWCEDEDCRRVHHDDESDDVWTCPRNPLHSWTHKVYTKWIEERGGRMGA